MHALKGLLGVLLVACGSSSVPRPLATPIERSETVPSEYERLGTARAECHARPTGSSFRGVPATSFDCTQSTLERALMEQVNARGGSLLAHQECRPLGAHGLSCSGEIARAPATASALSPGTAVDDDELPVSVASRVRIDLEARGARFERVRRRPADVTEFVLLPVGHVDLGVMRAHCRPSDCNAEEARAGLRLAAGGLGASDLVGVRCFVLDDERACVATLAMTELDPATDARAR